ncbi:uncharacterized protein LOC658297 [Tribolium castaneum]|uniref:uncharacterized protein LOC658297 n=1 Tax=Tribolium castaneum TaxID=7070 RepID=UPI0030FF008A
MEHTGYLGNSRVVLNHYDVSTQADIQHVALTYESEDEIMGRPHRSRRGTAHYSKQDIREQYCISDRGLGALESDRQSLFGCLSSHQSSPCSNRASFLTACVRQKVPSDENLYDLYRRHPADYAPYPRRSRYPWGPLAPEIYRYDEDLKSSYFRRKVHTDPSRYTWMPSDDESVRMEKPKSILEPYHPNPPAASPPAPSKKHVSFARSHTMASFDDAMASLSSSSSHLNRMTRSQERLLDVRKAEGLPITRQPEPSDNLLIIDKVKRAPMKTQATQTEACLGRKPLPPGNINLSPRTIHRVKMVSQGAQTNGFLINGRKLIKSFSEAGTKFKSDFPPFETIADHEPLQRTQSDEPPRSPFIVTSPPHLPSDSSSLSRSDHESEDSESKKEIFIDFKPQVPTGKVAKRPLTKTVSDGEMLLEQRKTLKIEVPVVSDKQMVSYSHEHIVVSEEERSFTPYFQKAPIRHEGICRQLGDTNVYSSLSFDDNNFHTQDSIDEEFHENLIYNRMYMRQDSVEYSPSDECVVPSVCLLPDRKLSPFASNDSLTNDVRDHSDGIWNESQATVLQVDSGTDNGTALSSSEMTSVTSPGSAILLTPSSRRKHLLMMQHQQRSSMDTEALEEEFVEQGETSPRIIIEKPKQYLTPGRNLSPSWRRKTPETPAESPLPAVVPDLLLARTDSCKTNTDVSESTTTDDYITANSGTDSSRKSGSTRVDFYNLQAHLQESSFESSKGDIFGEDMVVPSFSPPVEEPPSMSTTPVPEVRTGRSTPSESSSSYGSYSVDGSCPDLLERSTKVPSKDEVRYESPSPTNDTKWQQRRPFTLDIKHQATLKPSPSNEKPKRAKSRTRSPMQTHKKHYQIKKAGVYGHQAENKATSDESSCDFGKHSTNQTSPRKGKKGKENNRRKSLPRSPTQKPKKSVEMQPSSLPGSLSRRKSKKSQPEDAKSTLTLYSPSKRHSPDTAKLKALSAESLRSVSPGSDSVFYSDPSSHTADHQVHCLHCGKEVDIVTTDDPDKSLSSNGTQDIVQPPAGFEDSPRAKHPPGRLYKKLDRRFRSEDRQADYRRQKRYKPDVRAKSEERGAKTYRAKLRPMAKSTDNSQEVLKATDSSPSVLPGAPEDEDDQGVYDVPYMEGCWIYVDEREEVQRSKGCTPTEQEPPRRDSVSSTESEQEFRKRYQAVTHRMVHRKSCLEMYKRQTSRSFDEYLDGTYSRKNETVIKSFRCGGALTMALGTSLPPDDQLRTKLEEILKLMLVIWCRENQALNLVANQKNECDKTVVVHRESGEFGFRIHGSKPVVVSAIEPGTPAETSGLEVGDIVLAVNGVSVLDKSHSEVVKIAHAGSDTLSLEVARTCYALNSPHDEHSTALYSGYLWKLSGYASGNLSNKWIRRWFCLKQNNCLYYYKTDSEKQPVGVVMLFDHEVRKQSDDEEGVSKNHRFVIYKPEAVPLHLAADNGTALNRWYDVISRAISDSQTVDEFLEKTKKNLTLAPNSISNPDCFGYLVKLGTQWKSWSKRYCVLKDACLYFYQDAGSKCAFGVAYLQGYRVQQSITGNKKHAFEIIPPDPSKKHFYFHTESDADRKRWIAALEYSIDRWLKIQ